MSTFPPIVPELPAEVRASYAALMSPQKELGFFQKLVKSDKSAIVAGVVHVAVLLAAAFELHLDAKDIAVLGSIVSAGTSYFVSMRLPLRK